MKKKGIGKIYKDFVSGYQGVLHTGCDTDSTMMIMTSDKGLFKALGYNDNRSKDQIERDMKTVSMFKDQLAKELEKNGAYNHALMFSKVSEDGSNPTTAIFAKDINDLHGVLCRCVDRSYFYDNGTIKMDYRAVVGGEEIKTERINLMSDVEIAKYRITQMISNKIDEKYLEFVAYNNSHNEEYFLD